MADKATIDTTLNPSATTFQLKMKQYVIPLIKLHCTNIWQINWKSVYTKLREIKKDVFIWSHPIDFLRKYGVILTRFQIGHTQITDSYLMRKNNPPIYRSYNISLTTKHMMKCRSYCEPRMIA